MIDYNSCDKIIKYLNDGNLEKLLKYVESERDKYYLQVARKTIMEEYFKKFGYGYCECLNTNSGNITSLGNFYITDGYSAYFLEDSSILTPKVQSKYSIGSINFSKASRVFETYKEQAVDVERIEMIDWLAFELNGAQKTEPGIRMYSSNNDVTHTFRKRDFTITKKLLGDADIKYKLYQGLPVYIAESSRGKCMVFGIQRVPINKN